MSHFVAHRHDDYSHIGDENEGDNYNVNFDVDYKENNYNGDYIEGNYAEGGHGNYEGGHGNINNEGGHGNYEGGHGNDAIAISGNASGQGTTIGGTHNHGVLPQRAADATGAQHRRPNQLINGLLSDRVARGQAANGHDIPVAGRNGSRTALFGRNNNNNNNGERDARSQSDAGGMSVPRYGVLRPADPRVPQSKKHNKLKAKYAARDGRGGRDEFDARYFKNGSGSAARARARGRRVAQNKKRYGHREDTSDSDNNNNNNNNNNNSSNGEFEEDYLNGQGGYNGDEVNVEIERPN